MKLVPKYRVELIEDEEGGHNYSIDGRSTYLPGVTTILNELAKPALVPWAAKCTAEYMGGMIDKIFSSEFLLDPLAFFKRESFKELLIKRSKKQPRFVKEKAAHFGSSVHKLLDLLIKDPQATFKLKNPEMETVIKSCQLWSQHEHLKIISGDTAVASLQHGYGGSLDLLLEDDKGVLWIGDFKTANALYPSHAYQVGAYSQATKETYGLDYLPPAVVIRFGKKRIEFERREIVNIKPAFDAFANALSIYRIGQENLFSSTDLMSPTKRRKKVGASYL